MDDLRQRMNARVKSYLGQEPYAGINSNPGAFQGEVNEHSWITGDDAGLRHIEVIGSGASGDVHQVCHEISQ